jgi:CheY-like chemotaxis protein
MTFDTGSAQGGERRRSRLESVLLERGLVDVLSLQEALDRRRGAKRPLVEVLVEQGVPEEDLVRLLASVSGLPVIAAEDVRPDAAVQDLLPLDLARELGVLALSRAGQELTVAVSDPFDLGTLWEHGVSTGLRIRAVIAPPSALAAARDHAHPADEHLFEMLKNARAPLSPVHPLLRSARTHGPEVSARSLANLLLADAVRQGAKQVVLAPRAGETTITYRSGDQSRVVHGITGPVALELISALKILARLDLRDLGTTQQGRTEIEVDARRVELKITAHPGSLVLDLGGGGSPAPGNTGLFGATLQARTSVRVPVPPAPATRAPEPAAAEPGPRCPKCGQVVRTGWRVCPVCGGTLSSDPLRGLIVVCDDQAVQRKTLRAAVAPIFERVAEAADGPEALRLVEQEVPELLLIDQVMPGMTGIVVIRMLRARLQTLTLPIVMLTSQGAEEIEESALDAGADDYLRKPITPERLRVRIRALLRARDRWSRKP